jgi:hypothetical protein
MLGLKKRDKNPGNKSNATNSTAEVKLTNPSAHRLMGGSVDWRDQGALQDV